jgi:hypothetical protein
MSGMNPHVGVPTHARGRRAPLALAAGLLLTLLGASLFAGLAGAEPSAAARGGTASTLSTPPTEAEVKAWEASFLADESNAAPLARSEPASKVPGRRLFPQNKVVALYGAAGGFGVLGRKNLKQAARKLRKQVVPYRRHDRERIVKAFDLVAVVVTECSGRRDKCRTRVSDSVIRRYLSKIRDLNGRLILDIQPGRANVLDEIKHLRPFLRQPNVDVAIDAEWNVGEHGEPGEDLGSIRATRLNRATKMIRKIVNHHDLPPKLMIVHQFRRDSVKNRTNLHRPDKVDVTINYDGIGSPKAKRSGYRNISSGRLFNGFSLFYQLDDHLMRPQAVLGLSPKPDYVMYQ